MNNDIKKKADANDAKGLKYIFVDSLDVDPTFEVYAEEFEYCRKVNGFLEPHVELTPFQNDSSMWNENYWVKLKTDLLKNFSEKRFSHMKQVAKVVKKEKLERLLKERAQRNSKAVDTVVPMKTMHENAKKETVNVGFNDYKADDSEKLKREIEESQRVYQEELARRARTKAQLEAENKRVMEETDSKKGLGVVLVLAVIVLLIILVVVL